VGIVSDATQLVRDAPPASTVGEIGRSLLERALETEAIDDLLDAAREGSSGVLVLRGEPGMGKSSLLAYAVEAAAGMRVAALVGVETEMEFSYAALHKLLAPELGRMDELPPPQREALGAAFGLVGGSPIAFLVGLAALRLLSTLAEERPLLCVVDDADRLDQASGQVLGFVARRVEAERIACLFSVGDAESRYLPFEGLPELRLTGLSDAASRDLLAGAVRGRLDEQVRDLLVAEMGGNPLALLELPAGLTQAQLGGTSTLPRPLPVGERLEKSFLRRIRRLPTETQSLLLLISAEQNADSDLVWRAARRLDIDPAALGPAEAAGLVQRGPPLTFRHPFVRSAVYYDAAALSDRQRVHRALAAALKRTVDPDRKAWHLAAAAHAPDASLAAELERAAVVAQTRGGYAARAALLQRAAELTSNPTMRAERFLGAAHSQLAAGAVTAASALVAEVVSGLPDALQRVDARRLNGAIELARGSVDQAPHLLLQAAREFAAYDARRSRDTHLEALAAALYAGSLGRPGALLEAARSAHVAPRPPDPEATAADLLLDGCAALITDGHAAAAASLRAGMDVLCRRGDLRWFGLGYVAAFELWDDEAILALATRHVQLARETGALTGLPNALSQLGAYEVLAGRFGAAEALFDESREVATETGNPGILGGSEVGALAVAAWRGRARTRALARKCARDGISRGVGVFASFAQYALAVFELGRTNYAGALTAAQEASADTLVATRTLPELVEAAVRSGETNAAVAAVDRLAESAQAGGTQWGLGTLARSRALIAERGEAEAHYREAIERLRRCRASPQLARTRLLYGEWLRRVRRRRDSRAELRAAHQMFVSMGAQAYAERAEIELDATGERLRPRRESSQALTPHELRIVRLVSAGATNREVAVQLFISPRTVEYHLSKVFKKLGVTSRTQLARVLVERGAGT
jgi:DNA-binding CsgD family transcriptional regulator